MSLSAWLKTIADKEMPAFRRTASEVRTAASDPETGSEALGKLILRDPVLTAKVLRISNTVFYNPSGRQIQTITRAIMLLGVDAISGICLGLALMESLLKGPRQDRVMVDLGRSIHAALMARTLAALLREPQSEEVFIAGLLYRVGHMVFWCFAEDEGDALDAVLKPGVDEGPAERAVLGFSLGQLSHALVDDWKLSPVLVELFRGRKGTIAAECVLSSWRWVLALREGWEGPGLRGEIEVLAERLQVDPATATALFARVAREARDTAILFGSSACADTIATPPGTADDDAELFAKIAEGASAGTRGALTEAKPQESPEKLLECLRALSSQAKEGRMTEMFPTLLAALHEGVGMERVVFATLAPGDQVQGRLGVGLADPAFVQGFRFVIRRQMGDTLSRAIEQGAMVENLLNDPSRKPASLPEGLVSAIQGLPFLFGTLVLGGKPIGLIYGDRGTGNLAISTEMVDGFRHIVQQANLLLTQAAQTRAAAATSSS